MNARNNYLLKSRRLGADVVVARRKRDELICSLAVGRDSSRNARRGIVGRDGRPGDDRSRRVGTVPVRSAAVACDCAKAETVIKTQVASINRIRLAFAVIPDIKALILFSFATWAIRSSVDDPGRPSRFGKPVPMPFVWNELRSKDGYLVGQKLNGN